jgi:hypothetical protein
VTTAASGAAASCTVPSARSRLAVLGHPDPALVVFEHDIDGSGWLAPDLEADQRLIDQLGSTVPGADEKQVTSLNAC